MLCSLCGSECAELKYVANIHSLPCLHARRATAKWRPTNAMNVFPICIPRTQSIFLCAQQLLPRSVCRCHTLDCTALRSFVMFSFSFRPSEKGYDCRCLFLIAYVSHKPHTSIYLLLCEFIWFRIAKNRFDRCAASWRQWQRRRMRQTKAAREMCLFYFHFYISKAKTVTTMKRARIGNNRTLTANCKLEKKKWNNNNDGDGGGAHTHTHTCTRWELLQC